MCELYKKSDIESVEYYIKNIKSNLMYHNDIPKELENNIEIIKAECDAGIRTYKERGYDVIRNRFFVFQTIKLFKSINGNIYEKNSVPQYFETFGEYFEYLNGDIYELASYYQYNFTDKEILTYKLDLSKINNYVSQDDTLAVQLKKLDSEYKQSRNKVLRRKYFLLEWREKFNACLNYQDFVVVAKEFRKSSLINWKYIFSTFASANPKQNIPIIIQYVKTNMKEHYFEYEKMIDALCLELNDDSIYDRFWKQPWRKRSEIKSLIKGLKDGDIVEKFYDIFSYEFGLFGITRQLIDTKEECQNYNRIRASITFYYENLSDYVNLPERQTLTDLLPTSYFEDNNKNGFFNFVTNYSSKDYDPQLDQSHYRIYKKYDALNDEFVVKIERVLSESYHYVWQEKEYKFWNFEHFVLFLEGDLADADLSLCDGLHNIKNLKDINLKNALLPTLIKDQLGVSKTEDSLTIFEESILEYTLKNENNFTNKELIEHKEYQNDEIINHSKVFYISDLHLSQKIKNCKNKEDIIIEIKKIALKIAKDLTKKDILLIVGDTACQIECFKIFVNALRDFTVAKVVFLLGNHELWCFEGNSFSSIVDLYRRIILQEGFYFLQNNIIYKTNEDSELKEIPENELMTASISDIRKKLLSAQIIIFGGLGFSGCNEIFNANHGIYKNAISRSDEIRESASIQKLYNKVKDALYDRAVIVVTHTPLSDWSKDAEPHVGFIYVNGHTHVNHFIENEIVRVYADNQVGYYGKSTYPKYFYVDREYDLFVDYEDGIHSISRGQYIDFCRGKGIVMSFNRYFEHLFLLKRDGYYCFLMENEKHQLSILNGGSTKIIKCKSVEQCFLSMAKIINDIKSPFDKFYMVQKHISKFVQKIGGSGSIHGAIIDIDYSNHIYINPNDLNVYCYWAENMSNKILYNSFEGLLVSQCPHLLNDYNNILLENTELPMQLIRKEDDFLGFQSFASTEMYKYSNIVKKMQKLHSNILSIWPENKLNLIEKPESAKLENKKVIEKKIK